MVLGFGDNSDGGSGSMMGTVVYISVFVIVFALLLGYAAPLLFVGTEASTPTNAPRGFEASKYATVNFFETTNGKYEYSMTPSKYGTFLLRPSVYLGDTGLGPSQTDAAKDLSFDAGDFNVYLYAIKEVGDSKEDEYWFFSHSGWWDANFYVVTESEIERKVVDGRASVPISVGGSFTAYFTFPKTMDASYYLDDRSGFNISVGQSFINATKDKSSFWNVITGLLTFNLPNGGTGIPLIDIAISVAFISCCAFIIFWAATRIF
jgi:hypothetical protein